MNKKKSWICNIHVWDMNLNNLVIKYDQQKADSREDDILAKHGLKT